MPLTKKHIKSPSTLVIKSKDVKSIYSCHRTTANRKLNRIRMKLNKTEKSDVTIYEFSSCTGIELERVIDYLKLER